MNTDWSLLWPLYRESIVATLVLVSVTMLIGGVLGLALGVALHTTRRGGILANRPVFTVLNALVNTVRPVPFIILIAAVGPLTLAVAGTTIGTSAAIVPLVLAATFGISRIVEQNLLSVDPGTVEAAVAMGATPWRVIRTVLLPEALGPLVLGYTFVVIAVVDMTAIAGAVGGGGLGDFALTYGYQRFNWEVTWLAVATLVVGVHVVQTLGHLLSRRLSRQ